MKLFGRKNAAPQSSSPRSTSRAPVLRALRTEDIGDVCNMIQEFDEDDAEEAFADFTESVAGHYVYWGGDQILGCTGYVPDAETLGAAWLGWTYIAESQLRRGYGTSMMLALRNEMERADCRRLFIDTSDYKEDGVDIYAGARKFYEDHLQARREIVLSDFYQPGEAKYVYSLPVLDFGEDTDGRYASYDVPEGFIQFRDLRTAAETETGYLVAWAESAMPGDQLGDLARLIDRARGQGGHLLTISLPGALAERHKHILSGAGLSALGQVQDYYAPGVHDSYWGIRL